MTITAMPALSAEQMDIIHRAASHVPPAWQERFMSAVCDQLMGRAATISNAELLQVTGAIRRHMILGSGPVELGDDEVYA